jgi:hypothetical protein
MESQKRLAKYEYAERSLLMQFFEDHKDKLEIYAVTDPKLRKGYDAYFLSKKDPSTYVFVEAKVRSFAIDKYQDWFLEVRKLQTLTRYTSGKLLYVNFFPNEKGFYDAIFFNISKRLEIWKTAGDAPVQKIYMNAQTFKSKEVKTEKDVILLSFDSNMDTMYRNTQWRL